jgi:hypothetical protein
MNHCYYLRQSNEFPRKLFIAVSHQIVFVYVLARFRPDFVGSTKVIWYFWWNSRSSKEIWDLMEKNWNEAWLATQTVKRICWSHWDFDDF